MELLKNHLNQPVGEPVENGQPVERPFQIILEGRFCRVEPVNADTHASDLFAAFQEDKVNRLWTYLPYGPFEGEAEFRAWLSETCLADDPLFYAVIDTASNKALGVASYLRINPEFGVIEVGHINFSPRLQRASAAIEAMFLMMQHAFTGLGYRRYEWKCDSLNKPSRRAAERLGFRFEGVFRQATMYKGRNRDTAWYSIIDMEWPEVEQIMTEWLKPDNFDQDGSSLTSLSKTMKLR